MSSKETLIQLLRKRSVRRGNFILASGKSSNIYIDARLTTMSPEGLKLIGSYALEQMRLRKWAPDSVGGLTLGADPVAYAISRASADTSSPVRAFTVRKEPKTHGTGRLIEGPFLAGDRIVIIEDVVTTGKSAIQAIDAVEKAGGLIIGVLSVVDREEGGREAVSAYGFDVMTLTTLTELTA